MARYLFPYGHESKNRKSFSLPKGQHSHAGCPVFHHVHGGRRRSRLGGAFHDDDQIHIGGYGGLSFAIFSVAISIGRLFGDRLVEWLGIRKVMTSSGIIAAHRLRYCDGSAVGVDRFCRFCRRRARARQTLIPLLFTIASRQKKMPVPQAISSVTTLGYLGLLVGPAMMGFIAHATSLYVVFGHCRGTHDFRQCHVALAA